MYIKIESTRLDYIEKNQAELRCELYSGIVDVILAGQDKASMVGKLTILPATFIGGPRDMRKRYTDAMTLVKKYGKPDLFITMTCNPNCVEIKNKIAPGEEAQNRPDLTSRNFRAKVEELKNDIFKKEIFGCATAYPYVIEFQKRGLSYMHILVILEPGAKILCPNAYDDYVCDELPNSMNEYLRSVVIKHMMHGPCGQLNRSCACMKKGSCKYNYPKQFCEKTTETTGSFPMYKRSKNGDEVRVRGYVLDKKWVIPYNPYLLAKYNCHLNVEICCSIKAVKYLYNYIFKGHDRVAFNACPADDEFLLRVGNGTEPHVVDGRIRISHEMLLSYKDDKTSMNELVDIVFPNIFSYNDEYDSIVKREIWTPKNDFVDELNSMLIQRFLRAITKYYSHDEAIDASVQAVEEDFLNSLTSSGFPPHELLLKANCPLILLRNLDPPQGMSNGTRSYM